MSGNLKDIPNLIDLNFNEMVTSLSTYSSFKGSLLNSGLLISDSVFNPIEDGHYVRGGNLFIFETDDGISNRLNEYDAKRDLFALRGGSNYNGLGNVEFEEVIDGLWPLKNAEVVRADVLNNAWKYTNINIYGKLGWYDLIYCVILCFYAYAVFNFAKGDLDGMFDVITKYIPGGRVVLKFIRSKDLSRQDISLSPITNVDGTESGFLTFLRAGKAYRDNKTSENDKVVTTRGPLLEIKFISNIFLYASSNISPKVLRFETKLENIVDPRIKAISKEKEKVGGLFGKSESK